MEDLERKIDRSSYKIPQGTLERLFKLTLAKKWLEPMVNELEELWNLCDNEEEKKLIEDLIMRYTYLTSTDLGPVGENIAKHICETWKLSETNCLVVAVAKNSEADGSQFLLQSLKNKFSQYGSWSEANFLSRMSESVDQLPAFNNVVLLDDFIGSGGKISNRVKWYQSQLQKKGIEDSVKLYVVAAAGMEFSKPNLNLLGVDYYSPIWLKKGISEHFTGESLTQAISIMKTIEERLEPKVRSNELSKYTFGYKKSEALFAIEPLNVPNNVFPVFWWPELKPKIRRKTLFRRL